MPHNYGLISDTDAATIEKTLDLIIADFPNQPIKVLELGLYSGATGNGIRQYIESKGRECELTGVDSGADGQQILFPQAYNTIIEMPTTAAAYLIPEHSQHFIFVDAAHNYTSVISDFFAYKNKVKYDGFIAFHDTGSHIAPFTDFQKTGDPEDADQHIAVRKALNDIGLLDDKLESNTAVQYSYQGYPTNWELVFDEADPDNEAGGICVFKRVL